MGLEKALHRSHTAAMDTRQALIRGHYKLFINKDSVSASFTIHTELTVRFSSSGIDFLLRATGARNAYTHLNVLCIYM